MSGNGNAINEVSVDCPAKIRIDCKSTNGQYYKCQCRKQHPFQHRTVFFPP